MKKNVKTSRNNIQDINGNNETVTTQAINKNSYTKQFNNLMVVVRLSVKELRTTTQIILRLATSLFIIPKICSK